MKGVGVESSVVTGFGVCVCVSNSTLQRWNSFGQFDDCSSQRLCTLLALSAGEAGQRGKGTGGEQPAVSMHNRKPR